DGIRDRNVTGVQTCALPICIKRLAEQGWVDLSSWALIAAAAAMLTWFVRRCLTRPDPLLDVRLFRNKPFAAGALAALTSSFAWGDRKSVVVGREGRCGRAPG